MSFERLIKEAVSVTQPRQLSDSVHVASVGAALETISGKVYTGICIDTSCSLGFCAEHSAIAEMIKQGESRIKKIVAVHQNGSIYAPCGRCRELIYQIDPGNIQTEVMVATDKIVSLTELLPYR